MENKCARNCLMMIMWIFILFNTSISISRKEAPKEEPIKMVQQSGGIFYASETQNSRIEVQTIYHNGRTYDVFLNSRNSTSTPFVIRVK